MAAGLLLLLGHIVNLGGDREYGTVLGGTLVLSAHALLVFALVALWACRPSVAVLWGRWGWS